MFYPDPYYQDDYEDDLNTYVDISFELALQLVSEDSPIHVCFWDNESNMDVPSIVIVCYDQLDLEESIDGAEEDGYSVVYQYVKPETIH